jgi:metal-responsive CopG/Arc/MetJ family transcriptional regulator
MKTAISIPDQLFEAADRMAKRLGLSRSELYQRAVRAFLIVHDTTEVTEALDRIYGSAGETARLDPALEAMQLASIEPEEW